MSIRLSCPSCNTSFTLPDLPADRRANCPRCRDQFPIRTFEEVNESEATSTQGTSSVTTSSKAGSESSVKAGLFAALGLVLLAVIGLVGYYFRSGVQPRPQPEQPRPDSAIPADQLIGLGNLPDDTNIVFAIQPGPVVAYAERMKKDPRELLIQAGIPARLYDQLTSLGLTLQQIEQVIGGTSLGDGAVTPRFSLVVVLRGPLTNENEFLHKLQARKQAIKERYDIELARLPLMLARVSPTIWFIGWDDKDFKAVDRGGHGAGGKQLPFGLRQAIADQVPPDAAIWLAANDEQWAEKPAVKLLLETELFGKKEWLPVLAKGRSALVALSFDEPPRLRLFFKTVDAATGIQLRNYFQKIAGKDEKIRQGGEGESAFYDAPIDPMNSFSTIARFLSDAVKP